MSLATLEARVHYELDCLRYPAREWVPPRSHDGAPIHDAIIVGGGQSGVAIALRLLRERVTNIRVLDRSAAGLEGPWLNFARMHTLRTPKTVTGPDLGIPSLSARAWWEARFGRGSWHALDKIPRPLWQEYLHWVRRVTGVAVTNEAEVTDIEPIGDVLLRVHVSVAGRSQALLTRTVVLATGIEGSGRWLVPDVITQGLPRSHYAHSAEPIDFARLAGCRVAIVGGSASAFDNAAMAMEAGASRVELFVRRPQLPTVNPNRWMEFSGFMRHFGDLDDARKWRFMTTIFNLNQPPPQDSFDRCAAFAAFSMHLGVPILMAEFSGGQVRLTTKLGGTSHDFLIAGTGFSIDLAARPELARFAGQIALWADRYQPPPGEANAVLATYPYLSGSFQFIEKNADAAPFLRRVFSYTFGAMPSLAGSAGISALKFGVERIALGVTRELFLADADDHLRALQCYAEAELDPTRNRRPQGPMMKGSR